MECRVGRCNLGVEEAGALADSGRKITVIESVD
jgi:hypothetical protein